jgi:hypothetical protein
LVGTGKDTADEVLWLLRVWEDSFTCGSFTDGWDPDGTFDTRMDRLYALWSTLTQEDKDWLSSLTSR